MSEPNPKYKTKTKRSSPNGITINQQIASGVSFVQMYSKRAVVQDANNPVLAAMSVALARSVMESTKKPMTDELGQIVGVSMLAAFVYGQEAGCRIEQLRQGITQHDNDQNENNEAQ